MGRNRSRIRRGKKELIISNPQITNISKSQATAKIPRKAHLSPVAIVHEPMKRLLN